MLQFVQFQKSYGSLIVLKIADLRIEPGIFWIKGNNGSGKSTLLKTIAGILDFDGDILLENNISLKSHPVEYRKRINFADAEPVFPEFLSGKEMIKLFTSAKSAPKRQEEYFIESMNMGDYIDEPIGTYSTGMLKKLSIVLAFIGNPKIILLDEPLVTIDSESLKIVYQWIEDKHIRENVSFFLSSHQALDMKNVHLMKELLVENHTVIPKS